ncbi:glycosyltransferase [Actinobacillus pleuropneumoniae]|nr:glycosyltransferase [Actinobacillus pleuropneumoniae]
MTVFPRMIMHNQNPFYTGYGFLSAQHINEHRLERIIVPSSYTKYKLQEIGVTKPIDIIHLISPIILNLRKSNEKSFKLHFRGVNVRRNLIFSSLFLIALFP